ncbi:hypothetical protein KBC31_01445 [Candidatus Saccharibacteria bacterium]|jgi:ATP-dependent 26S proteasome regulatory subunit|nr:hypothetical protein [Candidatus Saccharibacteria bacterium]
MDKNKQTGEQQREAEEERAKYEKQKAEKKQAHDELKRFGSMTPHEREYVEAHSGLVSQVKGNKEVLTLVGVTDPKEIRAIGAVMVDIGQINDTVEMLVKAGRGQDPDGMAALARVRHDFEVANKVPDWVETPII